MKRILILVGCNFAVIIILFGGAELAVRIFVPQIGTHGTSKSIIADSLFYGSYGLRPLSSGSTNDAIVRVDKYGFRKCSVKIDTAKSSWLILGDSVTFGIGIEADSTFAGIIQTKVDSLNIVNPSVSGYNINNYWDVFRYFVLRRNHKLKFEQVSIFWCLNDVYTNVSDFRIPGGKIRYLLSDFLTYIRIHSRLYYFLKTLLFDRPQSYYLFDKSFYDDENPEFRHAIKKLVQINKLCQERKIRFNLVLLPYEYQLRKNDFTPQNKLVEALRNEGVKVLNPCEHILSRNQNSQSYFLYGDGIHLSNYGHRYIANFVLNQLKIQ